MEKQLSYERCKKRHYELWDFVINEIKAARSQALYIPCITDIKKDFFNMKGYEHTDNFCFACLVAEQRIKRVGDCACAVCPLNVDFCGRKHSPYNQLWDLSWTMDYDKAIKLAEEIRDSWEE